MQEEPIPPISEARRRVRSERFFTPAEETANWITHGIGLLLSTAALALLVVFSSLHGDVWHVLSFTVYGVTLVALYAASTIYHALKGESLKRLFKRLDYAAIFLLIAGTYTPFMLTQLRGPMGWTLLGIVWFICVTGVALQFFHDRIPSFVFTLVYVIAGWLVLFVMEPLVATVPRGGIWLLVAGGICYTSGVIFYVWHRLRYHHAIWHSFVLCGSICHFLAVLLFLLPWSH